MLASVGRGDQITRAPYQSINNKEEGFTLSVMKIGRAFVEEKVPIPPPDKDGLYSNPI